MGSFFYCSSTSVLSVIGFVESALKEFYSSDMIHKEQSTICVSWCQGSSASPQSVFTAKYQESLRAAALKLSCATDQFRMRQYLHGPVFAVWAINMT